MEDSVPEEEEIEWVVKGLQNNRAGGPSRMQAEDLKGWLAAARRGEKEREDATKDGGESRKDDKAGADKWAWVVDIVQTAFREGDLAEESTWQAVVLIPKGKGDYQGIGLVDVMWKVVAVILNRRFTSSITFHDVFHVFQEDHVEDLLPHGCKLLDKLGLEGGGPCAAICPESMEDVVVGDGGCETAI